MKNSPDSNKMEGEAALSDFECSICLQLLCEPVVGNCGHDFCKQCYKQWIHGTGSSSCPICRRHLPADLGVCLRLRNTIQKMFPRKILERESEVQKQVIAMNKRRKESTNFNPRSQQNNRTATLPPSYYSRHHHQGIGGRRSVPSFPLEGSGILDWVYLPDTSLPPASPQPVNEFPSVPVTEESRSVQSRSPMEMSWELTSLLLPRTAGSSSSNTNNNSRTHNRGANHPISHFPAFLHNTHQSFPWTLAQNMSQLPYRRRYSAFSVGAHSFRETSSRMMQGTQLREIPTRFGSGFQQPPLTAIPVPEFVEHNHHHRHS